MYHLSYIVHFFVKSDQLKMFQCVVDSIFINSTCLIGAVLFDIAIGVAHGYADSGCFQHGEVVGAVSECVAVFLRDGKAVQEKFHACGFAGALLCDFPDSVSVVKIGVMIVAEAAEFFYIGVRQHMHQEFVVGVGAGVFTVEFRDVYHGNFFSHSGSEFRLRRGCAVIQDFGVGFKECFDLAFAEQVYGFFAQKVGYCAEEEQFVIHVNVGSAAVYIAIEMEF